MRETPIEREMRYQRVKLNGEYERAKDEFVAAYLSRGRLTRFVDRWKFVFFGWFCADLLIGLWRWLH